LQQFKLLRFLGLLGKQQVAPWLSLTIAVPWWLNPSLEKVMVGISAPVERF